MRKCCELRAWSKGDIAGTSRGLGGEASGDLSEGKEVTCRLSEEVNEFGKPFVISSDGTTDFGYVDKESGLEPLPIKLSLGENSKDDEGKDRGYGYLHIDAGHRDQILQNGFASIEEFVETVARNYTEIKEGAKIGVNQTYLLEVSDDHNNTLFIQLSRDGKYWNVNSAGIFKKKYSRRKPKVYSKPAVGSGKDTDTTEVNSGETKGATAPAGNSSVTSGGKDNALLEDKQGSGGESWYELTERDIEEMSTMSDDRLRRDIERRKKEQAELPYYDKPGVGLDFDLKQGMIDKREAELERRKKDGRGRAAASATGTVNEAGGYGSVNLNPSEAQKELQLPDLIRISM